MNHSIPSEKPAWYRGIPLWLQTVIALGIGIALGVYAGHEPIIGQLGTAQLSRLGMLVIQSLKVLAVPLVALVVLDSLLRFEVPARQGMRLVRFCLFNVSVAMSVGLALTHWLQPGSHLRALFAPLLHQSPAQAASTLKVHSLSPVDGLASLIPSSIAAAFVDNAVVLTERSPGVFFAGARDALATGIATNSSLATVPHPLARA